MKPLLSTLAAAAVLTGVVYAVAATGALTDRPLAVLGVLLIGVGLVRHHRESCLPRPRAGRRPPPPPPLTPGGNRRVPKPPISARRRSPISGPTAFFAPRRLGPADPRKTQQNCFRSLTRRPFCAIFL